MISKSPIKLKNNLTYSSRMLGSLLAALSTCAAEPAASPDAVFKSAVAVWHLGDAKDAVGKNGPLVIEGGVKLGVELAGAEREASVLRGGDGRVAEFGGGYLRAGLQTEPPLAVLGKDMTLCVRLRDPAGSWAVPLFSKEGPADDLSNILFGGGGSLHYLWRAVPEGILRLRVPVSLINPKAWHDVLARFRGANLELFVDGVLVDEEWPHGELFEFCAPFLIGAGYESGKLKAGFHGQIDHVALWDRSLKDEEIAALAGGAKEVARRELEINGPVQTSPQYWKPRGYNTSAGDTMPFFHDGTFRLFYLKDRRNHSSKWGQGGHQYAQISSKDLIHWEEQPLTVPITEQWEPSMGTCDCAWYDGVYYMYWNDCGNRNQYPDNPRKDHAIHCATSTDGVHFKKDFKPLFYGDGGTVFRDPKTGLFHFVQGALGRMVSKDLRNWEPVPDEKLNTFPVQEPTGAGCSKLFEWNGWFYWTDSGDNNIWKSRDALGPWEEMHRDIHDGMFVPKVAEFTGNRRINVGFVFDKPELWGGHLVLHELVQYPDGSLGSKFVPELIPASGEPQRLAFVALSPLASGDPNKITIKADKGFAAAALDGTARNVRITLRVVPQPGAQSFGLCLRGKGEYESGCELRFDPARQRAQYGVPQNRGPANDSAALSANPPIGDFVIPNVQRLDQPFTLDIIVKGDLIDTCIDGRKTMITRRLPEPDGNRLFFFARDGEVVFESIAVRPLLEPK